GVRAMENENLVSKEMVLSPLLPDGKIGNTPPEFTRVRDDFQQKTKPGFVQTILWDLDAAYTPLLIAANIITAIGLLLGIIFRDTKLLILCGIPVTYMSACAVVLACMDRYAVPVYPIVMSNVVATPILVGHMWANRFKRTQSIAHQRAKSE